MNVRIVTRGLTRKLQWNHSGKWETLSLGKISEGEANGVKQFAIRLFSEGLNQGVLELARALPRDIQMAMSDRGMIPRSINPTVDKFFEDFLRHYAVDKKAYTVRNMESFCGQLSDFFKGRLISELTARDALDWHTWRSESAGTATRNREVKRLKQVFQAAIQMGYLTVNPAASLKSGAANNRDRFEFITKDEFAKVLDEAPNQNWRTILALTRFGGYRCDSEILDADWKFVDFEKLRIKIPAHKTAEREIPLFPEIAREFAQEPVKEGPIVTTCRVKSNLDKTLRNMVKRSGVEQWPILWHGQRKTRQTELTRAGLNPAAVRYWMGNSKAVAEDHYEFVTADDFKKAVE